MILLLIILLISPLLVFNNYIIYLPFIYLILMYKKTNTLEHLILSIIIGFITSLMSSNYYINIFLYPIISVIINYFFNEKKYNLKNIIIILMFIIFIYNTIEFIIFNILGVITYSYIYFITNLIYLYAINILCLSLIYIFIKYVNKSYN